MTKIENMLYLGNLHSASETSFHRRAKISHILISGGEIQPIFLDKFFYKKVNVANHVGFKIKDFFDECADFIDIGLDTGTGVLVHCDASRERSSVMMIAYLMKYRDFSLRDALNMLLKKFPDLHIKRPFMYQLKEYSRKLKKLKVFLLEQEANSGSIVNESIFSFRDHFKSVTQKKIDLQSRFRQASPHRIKSSFKLTTPTKVTEFTTAQEEVVVEQVAPVPVPTTQHMVETRNIRAMPRVHRIQSETTEVNHKLGGEPYVRRTTQLDKENVRGNYQVHTSKVIENKQVYGRSLEERERLVQVGLTPRVPMTQRLNESVVINDVPEASFKTMQYQRPSEIIHHGSHVSVNPVEVQRATRLHEQPVLGDVTDRFTSNLIDDYNRKLDSCYN